MLTKNCTLPGRFQEDTEEDSLITRLAKQINDRLDVRFTEIEKSLDERFSQLQDTIDSEFRVRNGQQNHHSLPIVIPPSTPRSLAIPHRSWSLPDVKRAQAATSRPPHLPIPLHMSSDAASSSFSSSAIFFSQSRALANKRKNSDGEANSSVLQTSQVSFKRPKRSVSSSCLPGIPTAQNFTAIMKQWEIGDLRNNLKPLKDWGPEERQGYLDYDNNVMAANYMHVSATYSKRKAVMEVYAFLGHETFMEKYKDLTVTAMVEGCQTELRSKREMELD